MALNITNVADDATLQLSRALDVTTAIVAGITYLFATGTSDNGISVFRVESDGTLTNVDNVADNATLELEGAAGATTAVVGDITYLFVAGAFDDGVSVFAVAADGTLTNVDNVTDENDYLNLALDNPIELTTAVVGGITYLFVVSAIDNGASVFRVTADGTLTNVYNVTTGIGQGIDVAADVVTAVIAGATYLFVAARDDDGVSVYSIAADGRLVNVDNVVDGGVRELGGASGLATAVVGGTPYLFVTGSSDDGVSVFSVSADGTLTNVANVSDDPTLMLRGATAATTAIIDGATYLFVTGTFDHGVSVFSVAADGTLVNVANIRDDATLRLRDPESVTAAELGGTTYLFVPGFLDSGVSVFSLDDERVPPLGDVLWQHRNGTVAIANNELGVVSSGWRITGTGDFDTDGDSDILWRHDDGLTVIWEMAGGDYLINRNLGAVGTTWQVGGTGDFDGDGDADILWRHQDGQIVTWEMEHGAYVMNHNLGTVGTHWQIAGTGDFDGDGDADMLWRHNDGQAVTWEMEHGVYVMNHNLGTVPTTWQVAGTGDFDGDGDADILWRHNQGQVVTWEMEDGTYRQNHTLAGVPTNWQIAGARDFDSDGDADILWRHTDGTVVSWEMAGGDLLATRDFGVVASAWQIRGTGEFDLL